MRFLFPSLLPALLPPFIPSCPVTSKYFHPKLGVKEEGHGKEEGKASLYVCSWFVHVQLLQTPIPADGERRRAVRGIKGLVGCVRRVCMLPGRTRPGSPSIRKSGWGGVAGGSVGGGVGGHGGLQ